MKNILEDIESRVNRDQGLLYLSFYTICNDHIRVICEFLENNPDITKLVYKNIKIGDEGAKSFAGLATLTKLDVSGCKIGDIGAKALASTCLISLNVSHNLISANGAKAFASNTTITSLDIGSNNIGFAGVAALANNTTLTRLNVVNCKITTAGAKALAKNTSLTSLNIERNNIRNKGAKALAKHESLKLLNVGFNNIRRAGAIALAKSKLIEVLVIWGNNINYTFTSGTRTFVNKLKQNKTLLQLSYDFSDSSLNAIVAKIQVRNSVLPWLSTVMYARLMAQAQRSDNCPLGMLPIEVFGIINNYAVSANHFSFFTQQFYERPSAKDLAAAKQMAMQ